MTAWNKFDWTEVPAHLEERLETIRQREAFRLLRGGAKPKDLGVSTRNALELIHRVRRQLEAAGYDPANGMTLVSPEPQQLDGRSMWVTHDLVTGEKLANPYWNKTDARSAAGTSLVAAINAAAESFKPLGPIKPRKYAMADLCTVYTLTDFHIGAYSWADETGADWDLKIAQAVMTQAFADMMLGSPDSEMAIFAQLGDFLHFDGLLALTPTSKHVLDADTRFELIVQTAIELCVGVIEMLLHKHQTVRVLMAEGNHDQASSVWLRAVINQAFKHNPRVSVDTSPWPFYAFKWGNTLLGWHHGHLQKMEQLPLTFATDPKFRSDYGQCKFTYIHTGHMHHQKVIDRGGIVVEQHPTLSARDAYAARGFLSSNRETKAITYHKESGENTRCTVRPNPKDTRKVA
jgi:hypothetical protein